ncbi:MAG: glycoside hydrolase family 25 protein [Parafilimonas sp.]
MENLIQGIDVSRWQGTGINWQQVKSAGYEFVFIKATDGSAYKQAFIEGAKKQALDAFNAGLKIGYYHFAHPSSSPSVQADALSEASYFITQISVNFPKPNFPLVVDFEDDGMQMNAHDADIWLTSFQQKIANAGYELMLYTYAVYSDQHLPSNHSHASNPLWIAKYPKPVNLNNPALPAHGWTEWQIWQYSESGVVQGISGNAVDLNVMKKDFFDKY